MRKTVVMEAFTTLTRGKDVLTNIDASTYKVVFQKLRELNETSFARSLEKVTLY
jgi:hypothetical protein